MTRSYEEHSKELLDEYHNLYTQLQGTTDKVECKRLLTALHRLDEEIHRVCEF